MRGIIKVEMKKKVFEKTALLRALELAAQGERVLARALLKRILGHNDKCLASEAMEHLGVLAMREGDYRSAIYWLSRASRDECDFLIRAWRMALLSECYRIVGLKRERVQAHRERLLNLHRAALADPSFERRIYALTQLVKAFDDLGLSDIASRYESMLRYYEESYIS